jgi:carbon-monoxide dehydrogenase small subunit
VTIAFILNGDDVVVKADANERLIDILRGTFKLGGAKAGCRSGKCGSCTVMMNGKIAPACLIPAFSVRGHEITTIEGLSRQDDYKDIVSGFESAGVETCEYCNSGKILVAESLLEKPLLPAEQEIIASFRGIKCRCTEPEKLVRGVIAAAKIRTRRRNGRGI